MEKEEDDESFSFSDSESDEKAKKSNWLQKRKRGVAGSAVGKALFNKFMDKETKALMRSLIKIVEDDQGKDEAKKVKKSIFKITVKLLMLYDDKKITAEQFEGFGVYFRRICSGVRNGYRTGVLDLPTAKRITEVALIFFGGIRGIVVQFLSKKTMQRLDALIESVCDPAFLVRASQMKEFDNVARTLASYLQ